MIARFEGKDPLNRRKNRTFAGTNRLDYNCGGYALETFNWYCPYREDEKGEFWTYWGELNDEDYTKEEVLRLTTERMIEEFKGCLRVIQDVSELQEGEYAIAYRIADDDFHFAKRNSKGLWFEKRGSEPKILIMKKEEVFGENWNDRYDSEVVLLAKKRNW